jgi:dTDP-4-amino-4,6-dideoxygalactose transaminase
MCDRLSESEQATDRAIILPLFHQMTEQEQVRVTELLKKVCQA